MRRRAAQARSVVDVFNPSLFPPHQVSKENVNAIGYPKHALKEGIRDLKRNPPPRMGPQAGLNLGPRDSPWLALLISGGAPGKQWG